MIPLASLCLFFAVSQASGDWTALPAPALCAPPPPHGHPPALWDGSHIRPLAARADTSTRAGGARLPLSTVAQMLEEDARASGSPLEFFRGSPQLLARGAPAALARARALLADLDQQAGALAVDLEVTLRELPNGAPADAAGTQLLAERARCDSGEEACFGSRKSESFVESFEVEVAADSGVSRPEISLLATGTTLHVWASRVAQGRSIFLSGLFDTAKQAERTSFDTQTNDLGTLEQPRLDVLQCAFSGLVESGKRLELEFCPKAGGPRYALSIQATTLATPSAADARGWRILDLAFLARDARALPRLGPGALLLGDFSWTEESPAGVALPPSAIAASLQDSRAAGADALARNPPPMYWTDDLLFVPRADAPLAERALELVSGAESLRGRTSTIELAQAGVSARFPVSSGFPARLLVGSEQPWLIGYHTELAPQTWMPAPEVAVGFDGLCVWIGPREQAARCAAWSVRTAPARVLGREAVRLGSLQSLSRELRSAAGRLDLEHPQTELFGGADRLQLALRAR
ncbi:MAG: hypothetical protein IPJ19_13075 [Planctomycetes bacterium]|nr:hypothetical protein [Planctomycetota bacterium]